MSLFPLVHSAHFPLLVLLTIIRINVNAENVTSPTFRNVLYQINDVLNTVGSPTNTATLLLDTFVYLTFYTLIPRFIISIRELYDQDVRGRFHIDTGFGVLSRSNAGLDMTVSGMIFADSNQGPEVEGGTDGSGDPEMGARVLHGSSLDENALDQGFEIGELVRTLHPQVGATSYCHNDTHLFFLLRDSTLFFERRTYAAAALDEH
ncbi:hypothetical protein JVT61DRAFT_8599 [Boletus reticuloceps]|uniref:Uncharacterized protein n=1 Tax=Boletus reticuloceps TaxID=495285 RepID=A0A8I2Z0F7_9AGAM|nr:hypothetical protein JVT61DRAFT_8599 [Boletus reticuloceps]